MKDDLASGVIVQEKESTSPVLENAKAANSNSNEMSEDDADEEDEAGAQGSSKTFLGYVYPSKEECASGGKASRTELFQCHRCAKYTRFPR